MNQTKPNKSAFDRHYFDSNNWKLGFIYFCRADQRIFVPKRIQGLGWTINYARPLAVPFLGFILAVVYGALELSRSFGTSGGAHLAISLLLALGLIALCYRLSIPRPESGPSDDAAAGKPQ